MLSASYSFWATATTTTSIFVRNHIRAQIEYSRLISGNRTSQKQCPLERGLGGSSKNCIYVHKLVLHLALHLRSSKCFGNHTCAYLRFTPPVAWVFEVRSLRLIVKYSNTLLKSKKYLGFQRFRANSPMENDHAESCASLPPLSPTYPSMSVGSSMLWSATFIQSWSLKNSPATGKNSSKH